MSEEEDARFERPAVAKGIAVSSSTIVLLAGHLASLWAGERMVSEGEKHKIAGG